MLWRVGGNPLVLSGRPEELMNRTALFLFPLAVSLAMGADGHRWARCRRTAVGSDGNPSADRAHHHLGRVLGPLCRREVGRGAPARVGLHRQGELRRWRDGQSGRPAVHDRPEALCHRGRERQGRGCARRGSGQIDRRRRGAGEAPARHECHFGTRLRSARRRLGGRQSPVAGGGSRAEGGRAQFRMDRGAKRRSPAASPTRRSTRAIWSTAAPEARPSSRRSSPSIPSSSCSRFPRATISATRVPISPAPDAPPARSAIPCVSASPTRRIGRMRMSVRWISSTTSSMRARARSAAAP